MVKEVTRTLFFKVFEGLLENGQNCNVRDAINVMSATQFFVSYTACARSFSQNVPRNLCYITLAIIQ